MDKKKPLGALSFFTPVDEEAVNFMKTVKWKGNQPGPVAAPQTGGGDQPKAPTRADLIAEAKTFGIKGADRMSIDELKEIIAAKKTEQR
jgi:hypothetical protein